MKFTLSWLGDHLDTTADPARLSERLTALGLEIEAMDDPGAKFAPFRVATVISAEQHPNADRLRLCRVDAGDGEVQVVCGAPNARTGMKGVYAPPGTTIPGTGMKLKPTKIRGVESSGMLLSERELGLGDNHDGIIDLPDDAPVGKPYAEYAGLDDPVFEIGLTPNRADCAGVRGIARDLAAAGEGRLKAIDTSPVPGQGPCPIPVTIADDARDACPVFIGRLIRGVKNGPSPKWLQDRLRAIGLRPISALVDITNYLTFDLARPLHVFDASKLTGGITVRLSHPGETVAALDDRTYTLDDAMTAITDDSGVIGLGGVIGGESTGCTDSTTDVFIECALFDPGRTAATGRKLQINSDARYRFERGVDPGFIADGMEIATRLVQSLCGGEASDTVVAGGVPDWRRTISFDPARVESLGGVAVPRDRQVAILTDLGFTVQDQPDGTLEVEPPSWRRDIDGTADLVEEVLRVHGFEHIPVEPMPRVKPLSDAALTPEQRRRRLVGRTLAARGLSEAVTWSFMSSSVASGFGQIGQDLKLVNPISSDLDVMRPSALANLAQAIGRNADRGFPDVGLFEVGAIFKGGAPGEQETVAAGARGGHVVPRHWAVNARAADVFDAKADALAALDAAGAPVDSLQISTDAPDWYHPGRSGCLRLGANVLAHFGELHPDTLDLLEVDGPVAAFEAFLDRVPKPRRRNGAARPTLALSAFQPISRDFAFIVEDGVSADAIVRAARGADKQLITDIGVFDVYAGKGMEPGTKSVAISVTLQPRDKTLTDEEIETIGHRIIDAVTRATGATLRG